MRNYYDVVDAHRATSDADLQERVELLNTTVEQNYYNDISMVLTNPIQRAHYRRMHLQYDAMAAVLARGIPQQDSNLWSKRVVEFAPEPHDLTD